MKALFLAFALVSCAHQKTPDLGLIRDWDKDTQRTYPQVPFLKKYSNSKSQVYFLAADHSSKSDSPTHRMIKEVMGDFRPEIVVIEGLSTEKGKNDQRVIDFPTNSGKQPEPVYAGKLAHENKIDFIGGEISSLELKEKFKSDLKNFVGFMITRSVTHMGNSKNDALVTAISATQNAYKLTPAESMTKEEYLGWYKMAAQKEFNLSKLDPQDLAPLCESSATLLNKVNCQVGRHRNAHLVSLINDLTQVHGKIFVVYGAGHLIQTDKALLSFLDEAKK